MGDCHRAVGDLGDCHPAGSRGCGCPWRCFNVPLVTWNAPGPLFRAESRCPRGKCPRSGFGHPPRPLRTRGHRRGRACAAQSGAREAPRKQGGLENTRSLLGGLLGESQLLVLARAERGGWEERGPVPGLGLGEAINKQKSGVRRSKTRLWVTRALPWAAQTAPGRWAGAVVELRAHPDAPSAQSECCCCAGSVHGSGPVPPRILSPGLVLSPCPSESRGKHARAGGAMCRCDGREASSFRRR